MEVKRQTKFRNEQSQFQFLLPILLLVDYSHLLSSSPMASSCMPERHCYLSSYWLIILTCSPLVQWRAAVCQPCYLSSYWWINLICPPLDQWRAAECQKDLVTYPPIGGLFSPALL